MRSRCARLEPARELAIERGHRDRNPRQVLARHRRQQIEVAHHGGRLGDDRHGMLTAREHLEHATRDLEPALDRLVWIGVGAERDRLARVAGATRARAPAGSRRRTWRAAWSRSRARATARGTRGSGARSSTRSRARSRDTGLIERSNGMSGEVLRTITLRLASGVTSVAGGGFSSRAFAPECPSRRRTDPRRALSKRTFGLEVAPRPLCRIWRSSRAMASE